MSGEIRKLKLCWGGGCPYIAECEDNYILFDDTNQIKIENSEEGVRILIPKNFGKKILEFVGKCEK